MSLQKTKDLLIRNVPLEVFALLEKSAKEHHRSRTQEALVALTNGLTMTVTALKKPKPFKWKQKITNKMIDEAIEKGRE